MNEGSASRFLEEHPQSVRVLISGVRGSTPREAGAWMLVSADATCGTIGGGQLEFMAMDRAREMIRGRIARDVLDIPLGPEIGQCCGGRVALELDLVDEAVAETCRRLEKEALAARPGVYLFGAGHVGLALADALSLLPVKVLISDPRENELKKAERHDTVSTPIPEELIRSAPAGSAFVILTHDHALDFLLAAEALARDDAAYAGMIGSRTKLKTFRSWYLKNGGNEQRFQRLVTPIGGKSTDKRPEVIACLVAAEVMRALNDYTASAARTFSASTA